ncbi:MAG TPA: winged helix-turn-helix domain-containing protein [Streptosporangiaceae bacterium]|nr:winged helix-turn-helix domain-containing protein [Streptosporangiaceae bacterium]
MNLLVSDYKAMVDYGSPLAPYRQIAAILRERIESGEYQPGQRLPSIVTLMQTYGVAHLTANKALRLLAAEGLAELSPGMGYYVTEASSPDARPDEQG